MAATAEEGRPFTHCIFELCLLAAVEEVCPDKRKSSEDVSLTA
jgi:hypothetical protein